MTSGSSGEAVLEGVDRLVLGAVVGEDALDVLHAADRPDVEEEGGDAQHAVDDVPHERASRSAEMRDDAGW